MSAQQVIADLRDMIVALTTQQQQQSEQIATLMATINNQSQAFAANLQAQNETIMNQQRSQQEIVNFVSTQLQAAEAAIRELRTEAAGGTAKSDSDIAVDKIIPKPKPFSGNREDWESWRWSIESYLTSIDQRFKELMDESVKSKESLDTDIFLATPRDKKLASCLLSVLTGYAPHQASMARTIHDGNGCELWRRLVAEFTPHQPTKSLVWLRVLLNPTFPKREDQWSKALHEWEAEIAAYTRETGKTIDSDLLLSTLHSVIPSSMATHIALNSESFTTYSALRKYVEAYLTAKRVWKRADGSTFGGAGSSTNPASSPGGDAMQVDAVKGKKGKKGDKKGQAGGAGKAGSTAKGGKDGKGHKHDSNKGDHNKAGGKGAGKGKAAGHDSQKGKGKSSTQNSKFDGTCSNCGKYGHKQQDCWWKGSDQISAAGSQSTQAPAPAGTEMTSGLMLAMKDAAERYMSHCNTSTVAPSHSASQAGNPGKIGSIGKGAQGAVFAVSSKRKSVRFEANSNERAGSTAGSAQVMYAMIDSGACESVSPLDGLPGKVNPQGKIDLYAVQGTPLQVYGSRETSVKIGPNFAEPAVLKTHAADVHETVLSVKNMLDRGQDVHFTRKGSWIQDDAGNIRQLIEAGKRFYLPFQTTEGSKKPASIIAPVTSPSASGSTSSWKPSLNLPSKRDDIPFVVKEIVGNAIKEIFQVAPIDDRWDSERAMPRSPDAFDRALEPFIDIDNMVVESAESPAQAPGEEDEDEELFPDSMTLDEVAKSDPQPMLMAAPNKPSPEEVARHEIDHLTYAPWCTHCVKGRGKQKPHRRPTEDKKPVVQLDFAFYTKDGELRKEEGAGNNARLHTVLNGVCSETLWPLCVYLPSKATRGNCEYTLRCVEIWINNLNHPHVIIRTDNEPSILLLANKLQQRLGPERVTLQSSPKYDPQSLGLIEGRNGFFAGLVRTHLSVLQERYPELQMNAENKLFPWLLKYLSWALPRYYVQPNNQLTSYRLVRGVEYGGETGVFGEVVLAKIPRTSNKAKSRWVLCVWVGKTDSNDSHICLCEEGAAEYRTVRRLPHDTRFRSEVMSRIAGTPWNRHEGVQEPAPAVTSEVVPMLVNNPPGTPGASEDEAEESQAGSPAQSPAGATGASTPQSQYIGTPEDSDVGDDSAVPNPPSPQREAPIVPPVSMPFGMNAVPLPPQQAPSVPAQKRVMGDAPPTSAKVQKLQHESGTDMVSAIKKWASDPSSIIDDVVQKKQKSAGSTARLMPTAAPALRLDSQQISAITGWANDPMSTVASIVDALEALQFIDPKCDLVRKSREEELSKLEGFSTFVPRLKDELIGSGCIVRNGVWVDKAKPEGIKSRFTCADIKPKGAKGDHNTFMPTPHSVSHKILELKALKNNWCVKTADIVSAFLIAEDPGDENGQPVFIRAPSEYQPFLEKWIGNLSPKDKELWSNKTYRDVALQISGNIYGRRTAGATFRNRFEEVLTNAPGFEFRRGTRDATVYVCQRTGATLLHHVDDVRCCASESDTARLWDYLRTKLPLKEGPLEKANTQIEVLGRAKIRTMDSIVTLPSEHRIDAICSAVGLTRDSKPAAYASKRVELTEEGAKELDEEQASRYRSGAGSAIYLSLDRRDVMYAVKELARRIQKPRHCDWQQLKVLARYLNGTRKVGTVLTAERDTSSAGSAAAEQAGGTAGEPWSLDVFTDTDWAGCPETRRSTSGDVVVLAGCVIEATTQTQPGLPATSSGEAEVRGTAKGAASALYIRQLVTEDFGIAVSTPKLWTDSTAALAWTKRIGSGKTRHLEIGHFFVQELVRTKQLFTYKVDGKENPANVLTKHLSKIGEQELSWLGMINLDSPEHQHLQNAERLKIAGISYPSNKRPEHKMPWKPNYALAVRAVCITTLASAASAPIAVGDLVIRNSGKEVTEITGDLAKSWTALIVITMLCLYLGTKVFFDLRATWRFMMWLFGAAQNPEAPQREAPLQVQTRTVAVQSPVTYTAIRGNSHPRFQPLPDWQWGVEPQ